MNEYSKVLIVGQSFHMKSGSGVTISNLFQNWPNTNLAVASNDNLSNDLDISVCENYYQLGYNGKLHPFPINIVLPKVYCGSLSDTMKNDDNHEKQITQYTSGRFKRIYGILILVLKFLGIYNLLYNVKVTQDFKDWIIKFNPDFIYSQLSTLELIRLVSEIHTITKKPIVLHIMDDWPETISKFSIFRTYWKHRIDKEFRALMDQTTVLMSISQSMSDEYKKRYDKDFIPFHNPIDVEKWLYNSKENYKIHNKFRILYTGRIGEANSKSLNFMANLIDAINKEQVIMELDIFTPDTKTRSASRIARLRGINIKETVPHSSMPSLLNSYDLLFLPLDFDKKGLLYAQFSLPTKASEYMISGTPILVFADKHTALAKYALEEGWAKVVIDNDEKILRNAIMELYSNTDLRKELGIKAKATAIRNENSSTVKENFRKCFILEK